MIMPSKKQTLEKKLITVIEKAIAELNVTYLHTKVKVTKTEYDEELKKPINEVVEESEHIERVNCEYDVSKIKALTELWLKIKETDASDIEKSLDDKFGVVILPEKGIFEKGEEDL